MQNFNRCKTIAYQVRQNRWIYYNKTGCLVLFDYSYCDKICDQFKHLISEKSDSTDGINHNFARIRIDSEDSLPIEKILTLHNVIILTKAAINKNLEHYKA